MLVIQPLIQIKWKIRDLGKLIQTLQPILVGANLINLKDSIPQIRWLIEKGRLVIQDNNCQTPLAERTQTFRTTILREVITQQRSRTEFSVTI